MNFSTVWLENSLKLCVTFVHLFEFQGAFLGRHIHPSLFPFASVL